MAWMPVFNSQTHSIFSSLGVRHGDTFTISEECLSVLEEILRKLLTEDCLRTFRRAIGYGQNVRKDLIPLLMSVKDDTQIADATKIIDTTIKILVNLTVPIEYLLSIETISLSEAEKHTILEINKLLITSKEAFTDSRSTKAVMDHIKYVVEKDSILNIEHCDSINNCLLLLRNILHIPEVKPSNCPLACSSMQNQILWNLFTQSVDKIIIYLMSCPQKMYWGVTIVQLMALMYKDQHVGTLQKLLNLWLEASLSESSEDNESNTSPPNQASGDSSPMITSDPTSDSSDNGNSGNTNEKNKSKTGTTLSDRTKSIVSETSRNSQNRIKAFACMKQRKSIEMDSSSGISSMGQSTESSTSFKIESLNPEKQNQAQTPNNSTSSNPSKNREILAQSEISDCGYVTQVENQESISTSSNDDDQPMQKSVHQKLVHQKAHQKLRHKDNKNRAATALEKKELRRKKLVKRSKTNIINMKGLMHHFPTDEDISNILKEFTVDFLLKGYSSLVQVLHTELLTNIHIQIDTSHFFWLVTYFLKFATQLELDLEHISPVLSYDVLLYLVFQGVWTYEEFEINCHNPNVDLKPCLRRLHLVVTAIKEFLQAIDSYQKIIHLSEDDHNNLLKLQIQISKIEDLRHLFILLLRQYNPKIQSKQYLQDLILTNHTYLVFLDNISKRMDPVPFDIVEHLKQFATVDIMRQYGRLLECFKENGEFVNNCIFTMMHHIGGDLSQIATLFQPSILKTFSQIWETDYEICDDWSDLIEYVIHEFINTPRKSNGVGLNHYFIPGVNKLPQNMDKHPANPETCINKKWIQERKDNFVDCNKNDKISNMIGVTGKNYKENGTGAKTTHAIIRELLHENIIKEKEYNCYIKKTSAENCNEILPDDILRMDDHVAYINEDQPIDTDIKVLRDYMFKKNKGKQILWLQKSLLEACFVKLMLTNSEELKHNEHMMEPVSYYFAFLNLPIPVVPWTLEQKSILTYQPFVLLLHKLGFYLPIDTGKVFVRIPNFWTADYIFSVAQQLGPIDLTKLKFDIGLLESKNKRSTTKSEVFDPSILSECGKFSMTSFQQTPAVVRYTPFTNQLSISIPECATVPCDLRAPELAIAHKTPHDLPPVERMECSPIHETVHDFTEKNSTCDTASVTSDLTRMCVSDSEDKDLIILIEKKDGS